MADGNGMEMEGLLRRDRGQKSITRSGLNTIFQKQNKS